MAEVTLTKKYQSSQMHGGDVTLGTLTTATTSDYAKTVGYNAKTLEVRNGITTSCIFTVEGGFKRSDGTIHWYTLATRLTGSATFATTALTITGSTNTLYEIAPFPTCDYVRVNVSTHNANGTTFYLHAGNLS